MRFHLVARKETYVSEILFIKKIGIILWGKVCICVYINGGCFVRRIAQGPGYFAKLGNLHNEVGRMKHGLRVGGHPVCVGFERSSRCRKRM